MKVQKFNEMADVHYKEYDEYAYIDIDVLNNWKTELDKIDSTIDDIKHDIHQYNDFIKEYVIFGKNFTFIPSSIKLIKGDNHTSIIFSDTYKKFFSVNLHNINKITTIDDVAYEDPKLFLELYHFYITKNHAPYMDIFGKDEFKHIIDAETKYNL